MCLQSSSDLGLLLFFFPLLALVAMRHGARSSNFSVKTLLCKSWINLREKKKLSPSCRLPRQSRGGHPPFPFLSFKAKYSFLWPQLKSSRRETRRATSVVGQNELFWRENQSESPQGAKLFLHEIAALHVVGNRAVPSHQRYRQRPSD